MQVFNVLEQRCNRARRMVCLINPSLTNSVESVVIDVVVFIELTFRLMNKSFSNRIDINSKWRFCHRPKVFSSSSYQLKHDIKPNFFKKSYWVQSYQVFRFDFRVIRSSSFARWCNLAKHILETSVWFTKCVFVDYINIFRLDKVSLQPTSNDFHWIQLVQWSFLGSYRKIGFAE